MFRTSFALITFLCFAACGENTVEPEVQAANPTEWPGGVTAKPQGPVTINYRIIGTPIVGRPLAIDIEISSLIGEQNISVTYRINDSTAMELAEAQPAEVSVVPNPGGEPSLQQVQLVPLREGRLFLNVSASVAVNGDTISSAIAIPIQVGSAPREAEPNGTITTDDEGAAIHSLPATEN